jgi:hypothetical protein
MPRHADEIYNEWTIPRDPTGNARRGNQYLLRSFGAAPMEGA